MAAVAEGKAAAVAFREGILRQFAMAGGDHEAVFVVGDRQIAIHLFDLLNAEAHLFNGAGIGDALDGLRALVVAHRHHPFQRAQDRSGIAGAQQIRQVLHRDAQTLNRRQDVAVAR